MGHVLEVYDKIKELFQLEWDASKTERDKGSLCRTGCLLQTYGG